MIARNHLGGDVAIIGAGLIGLSIAFELAGRGATVRIFDRGEPGRAASWAGAGMLAPYSEATHDDALLSLCVASLALYPSFVEQIRDAGHLDAHLRLDGILNAAFDEERMDALRARAKDYRARGIACELLDRNDTIAREPALAAHVRGSLILDNEGHVDNRRLGRALVAACESRGVIVHRAASNVRVECDDRRVLGVRSDLGFAPAAFVVNAAGAWASQVLGIPPRCVPHVEPVKGQMLALAIPRHIVQRTIWVPGAYLVPRDDGRLLIGATVEHCGYDERITAGGMAQLLEAALRGVPALRDFSLTETWAGLRPGTPDGRPLIGPSSLEGLLVATGHYRNGILLAPLTARMIADIVEGANAPSPRIANV